MSTRTCRWRSSPDHFERIMSGGYSVSLFTDWQKERIAEVWVKRRVEEGERGGPDASHGATLATEEPPPDRRALGGELHGADGRARAPGTIGCPTSAWGSRRAAARSCSPNTSSRAGTRSMPSSRSNGCGTGSTPHLFISEIRTIDADELWMSPCYKRPSLAIHFTWKPDWDSVRELLPLIEKELVPIQGPTPLGEAVRDGAGDPAIPL